MTQARTNLFAASPASKLDLSTSLKLSLLYLLTNLPTVSAEDVIKFGEELVSHTLYQFAYAVEKLPLFSINMIVDCGVAFLTDGQNKTYDFAARPRCTLNGVAGPGVNISVETGKNLTTSLVGCMNNVMADLCQRYYDSQAKDSSDDAAFYLIRIGIACGVLLFLGLVAFACVLMAKSNRADNTSVYAQPGYATFGLLGSHHHHHHNHHDHGSGNSSAPSNHVSGVGVDWSFGKSPV